MHKTFRIAHRGASGYAPENTLAAIEKAIELGVDMVELDVRKTKDSELVVFHDFLLGRLTKKKGLFHHKTFEHLQQLNVHGHGIPRLIDCLNLIHGKCQVNIEIKHKNIAEDVAQLVKELDLQKDVLISSRHHLELIRVKAIDSSMRVAVILATRPASVKSLIQLAQKTQAEAVNIAFGALRQKHFLALKQAGFKVNIWTVDEPDDILYLKKLGVDGIISNYPDRI